MSSEVCVCSFMHTAQPGYPSELYLQDLRGQERDLTSAREKLQRLNDSSQCGNVLPKLPLLSDGT
jgi:hypothetical protein